MRTITPKMIFKFDYFNHMTQKESAQIELFRRLKLNFASLADLTEFLEVFVSAITSDFGIIKTYYDMEFHDEDEISEDRAFDNPMSKALPRDEVMAARNIKDFIKVLVQNGKPDVVIARFKQMERYFSKIRNIDDVLASMREIISSDLFYPMLNKYEYPVLEVEDEMIEDVIQRVHYKNIRKGRFSMPLQCVRNLMTQYTSRQSELEQERAYHNKMVGLKGMNEDILLIEESKKKNLDDRERMVTVNFLAVPSFKDIYSPAGIHIWDSILGSSKVKYMEALIPS